jgi:protein TonB
MYGTVEALLTVVICLVVSACRAPVVSPAPQQQLILPRYPAMLQAANVGGTVAVALPISAEGQPAPRPSRVIESSHELFLASVMRAVSRWRFSPATRRAAAVPDTVIIRFAFHLDSTSRCGPKEVIWKGGPRPQLSPLPAPTYSFDPSTLSGTITACRTTEVKAIVSSSMLDGPRRH